MIVEGKGQRFQIKHDAAQVTSSIPHNTESHIEPAPPSQLGSQDAHFQWMPQAILNPSVPPPPGCEQLLEAGRFVIQLMRSKADSRAAVLPPREDLLPLKLQIELEQIASGCYKAFENQSWCFLKGSLTQTNLLSQSGSSGLTAITKLHRAVASRMRGM